jgi:protein tyrosine phosphatase
MFQNLDTARLENLFEAFKIKVLGKTQDYIQEFKVRNYFFINSLFNKTIFKLLKTESILTDSSKIANYNRSKNRYRNVVPYDFNRVKLIDCSQDNDYTNASHICLTLHSSTKNDTDQQYVVKYILAQPPLNNTICKFF